MTTAPHRWIPPLVAGVVLLGLSAALGAVILELGNGPFAVDAGWNSLLAAWTSDIALGVSWVLNDIGGGVIGAVVVPVGVALVLVLARRRWGAVYFLAASASSAVVVQLLKHLYGRARPQDIIVVSDFGSFPSGHTANAATIAVVMIVLFPRIWVGLAGLGWVVLMAFSRTYLHAHWLSDTLGGALAGAGATLVMTAVFAGLIGREAAHRAVQARAGILRRAGADAAGRRGPTGAPGAGSTSPDAARPAR